MLLPAKEKSPRLSGLNIWKESSDSKFLPYFSLKAKLLSILLIYWIPGGIPGFGFFVVPASIPGKKPLWITWFGTSSGPLSLKNE
jgi:hypothetical protein